MAPRVLNPANTQRLPVTLHDGCDTSCSVTPLSRAMATSAAALADDLGVQTGGAIARVRESLITGGLTMGFWYSDCNKIGNEVGEAAKGFVAWLFVLAPWVATVFVESSWPAAATFILCAC